jgi:hypothetical protein
LTYATAVQQVGFVDIYTVLGRQSARVVGYNTNDDIAVSAPS